MDAETKLFMQELAEKTAAHAVRSMLISLGLNPDDPIKMQEEFAALREIRESFSDADFAADLAHLRKWRKAVEEVESKGRLAIVGVIVSGLAAALWLGIKTKLAFLGGP